MGLKIAFDFDNTIAVKNEDGSIGPMIPETVKALNLLKSKGHEIYIFSGREDDEVRKFLVDNGISFDRIVSPQESYTKNWDVIIDDLSVNPVGQPAEIIVMMAERVGKEGLKKGDSMGSEAYKSRPKIESIVPPRKKTSIELLQEVFKKKEQIEAQEVQVSNEVRKKVIEDSKLDLLPSLLEGMAKKSKRIS